jgi:hypothetical protein
LSGTIEFAKRGGGVGKVVLGGRDLDIESDGEVEGWLICSDVSESSDDSEDAEDEGADNDEEGGDEGERLQGVELPFPTTLALVPGLGLVVREDDNSNLQFFATPDIMAMTSMSACRVGWLSAVARGAARRQLLPSERLPTAEAAVPRKRRCG